MFIVSSREISQLHLIHNSFLFFQPIDLHRNKSNTFFVLDLEGIHPNCTERLFKKCHPLPNNNSNNCYYHLPQLNRAIIIEDCINGTSYDYFSRSEVSFILSFTAIGAFIVGTVGLVYLLMVLREREAKVKDTIVSKKIRNTMYQDDKHNDQIFLGKRKCVLEVCMNELFIVLWK